MNFGIHNVCSGQQTEQRELLPVQSNTLSADSWQWV